MNTRLIDILGRDGASSDPAALPAGVRRPLSEGRARRVRGVLRPRRRSQVPEVVSACAAESPPARLHPISSGMNWGLGSGMPVADDCYLLDISGLDAILELDLSCGLAVIEAGVTQGALAERLRGSPFMLNVTASSSRSSVVGNTLERGVGFHGQRTADLHAVEVVLGSGEVLHLGGHAPITGTLAGARYPHGLGPNLAPLLAQSSLGIVTAAAIGLLWRPEQMEVVRLDTSPGPLGPLVELVARLHRDDIVRGASRIYHASSVAAYDQDRGPAGHHAYVCLAGTGALMVARRRALAQALDARPGEAIRATPLSGPGALSPLDRVARSCFAGDPSENDALIRASFGVDAARLDADSADGWLTFLPALPLDPEVIDRATERVHRLVRGLPLRAHVTVNVLSTRAADFVVGLRFARDAVGIEAAHRALDALGEAFAAEGHHPYRADVDRMGWLADRLASGRHAELLRGLKHAFDPAGIIAPGRYSERP